MTPRRRRRAPPDLAPGGVLDWSDRSHWARAAAPCRYCHQPTNLRDDDRRPAHKVCAEDQLHLRAARAVNAYQNGTL